MGPAQLHHKKGRTIRIDWKETTPDQYAMYFPVTSKLVHTFKVVYGDLFRYEQNTAIVLHMKDKPHAEELKHCIAAGLTYHKVKHWPLPGL